MKTKVNVQKISKIEDLSRPIMEKVAIIGAGLRGLAVAIALRKLGYFVLNQALDIRINMVGR